MATLQRPDTIHEISDSQDVNLEISFGPQGSIPSWLRPPPIVEQTMPVAPPSVAPAPVQTAPVAVAPAPLVSESKPRHTEPSQQFMQDLMRTSAESKQIDVQPAYPALRDMIVPPAVQIPVTRPSILEDRPHSFVLVDVKTHPNGSSQVLFSDTSEKKTTATASVDHQAFPSVIMPAPDQLNLQISISAPTVPVLSSSPAEISTHSAAVAPPVSLVLEEPSLNNLFLTNEFEVKRRQFGKLMFDRRDEFFLIMLDYFRSDVSINSSNAVVQRVQKEKEKSFSSIWKVQTMHVTGAPTHCPHQTLVSPPIEYQLANYSAEEAAVFASKLTKMKTLHFMDLPKLTARSEVAALSAQQHIARLLSYSPPFATLPPNSPPSVTPMPAQSSDLMGINRLRSVLQILFLFQKIGNALCSVNPLHCPTQQFIQNVQEWICSASSYLIAVGSFEDRVFLMHNLLMCPGIGSWGSALIQTSLPNRPDLLLDLFLASVIAFERERFSSVPMEDEPLSTLLPEIVTEDCAIPAPLLASEADVLALFEQFNFAEYLDALFSMPPGIRVWHNQISSLSQLFRSLLSMLNRASAAIASVSPTVSSIPEFLFKVGSVISLVLLRISSELAKFGAEPESSIQRDFDVMLMEVLQGVLLNHLPIMRRLSLSFPLTSLSVSAARHIFALLFVGSSNPEAYFMSALSSSSTWLQFMQNGTQLRQTFFDHSLRDPLPLRLLARLATRTDRAGSDINMIAIGEILSCLISCHRNKSGAPAPAVGYQPPVSSTLSGIALLTSLEGTCYETLRWACSKMPSLTSFLFYGASISPGFLDTHALSLFRSLPLHLWIPNDSDWSILRSLLTSPAETHQLVGRHILISLNWGQPIPPPSSLDGDSQMQMAESAPLPPHFVFFAVQLIVEALVSRASVPPSATHTSFLSWCWSMALQFNFRSSDGTAIMPPRDLSDPTFAPLKTAMESKHEDTSLIGLYLAYHLTPAGHLPDKIATEGAATICSLIAKKKYEAAIRCVLFSSISLSAFESSKNPALHRSFQDLLACEDKVVLVLAKSAAKSVMESVPLNKPVLFRWWMNFIFAIKDWTSNLKCHIFLEELCKASFLEDSFESPMNAFESNPDAANLLFQKARSFFSGEKFPTNIFKDNIFSDHAPLPNPACPYLSFVFLLWLAQKEAKDRSDLYVEYCRKPSSSLHKIAGKIGLKKHCTALAIYRCAAFLCVMPTDCPIAPLFWQFFFSLLLENSRRCAVPVPASSISQLATPGGSGLVVFGTKLLDITSKESLIDALKQKLSEMTKANEGKPLGGLFNAMSLWLTEAERNATSYLERMSSLPDQHATPHLASVAFDSFFSGGSNRFWMNLIDIPTLFRSHAQSLSPDSIFSPIRTSAPPAAQNSAASAIPPPPAEPSWVYELKTIPPQDLKIEFKQIISIFPTPGDVPMELLLGAAKSFAEISKTHDSLEKQILRAVTELWFSGPIMKPVLVKCNAHCQGAQTNMQVLCSEKNPVHAMSIESLSKQEESCFDVPFVTKEICLILFRLRSTVDFLSGQFAALYDPSQIEKASSSSSPFSVVNAQVKAWFHFLMPALVPPLTEYPPSQTILADCTQQIGRVFGKGHPEDIATMLQHMLQHVDRIPMLSSFFYPEFLPSKFVEMYEMAQTSLQSAKDHAPLIELFMRFDVAKWLVTMPQTHEILRLLHAITRTLLTCASAQSGGTGSIPIRSELFDCQAVAFTSLITNSPTEIWPNAFSCLLNLVFAGVQALSIESLWHQLIATVNRDPNPFSSVTAISGALRGFRDTFPSETIYSFGTKHAAIPGAPGLIEKLCTLFAKVLKHQVFAERENMDATWNAICQLHESLLFPLPSPSNPQEIRTPWESDHSAAASLVMNSFMSAVSALQSTAQSHGPLSPRSRLWHLYSSLIEPFAPPHVLSLFNGHMTKFEWIGFLPLEAETIMQMSRVSVANKCGARVLVSRMFLQSDWTSAFAQQQPHTSSAFLSVVSVLVSHMIHFASNEICDLIATQFLTMDWTLLSSSDHEVILHMLHESLFGAHCCGQPSTFTCSFPPILTSTKKSLPEREIQILVKKRVECALAFMSQPLCTKPLISLGGGSYTRQQTLSQQDTFAKAQLLSQFVSHIVNETVRGGGGPGGASGGSGSSGSGASVGTTTRVVNFVFGLASSSVEYLLPSLWGDGSQSGDALDDPKFAQRAHNEIKQRMNELFSSALNVGTFLPFECVYSFLQICLTVLNASDPKHVSDFYESLKHFLNENSSLALPVLASSTKSITSMKTLTQLHEDCIIAHFARSKDWDHVSNALVLPEVEQGQYIQECLNSGLSLALYAYCNQRLANDPHSSPALLADVLRFIVEVKLPENDTCHYVFALWHMFLVLFFKHATNPLSPQMKEQLGSFTQHVMRLSFEGSDVVSKFLTVLTATPRKFPKDFRTVSRLFGTYLTLAQFTPGLPPKEALKQAAEAQKLLAKVAKFSTDEKYNDQRAVLDSALARVKGDGGKSLETSLVMFCELVVGLFPNENIFWKMRV